MGRSGDALARSAGGIGGDGPSDAAAAGGGTLAGILRGVSPGPVAGNAARAIDAEVEEAFAPVYAAIPSLLDWHYSFIGQYAELGLALTGGLEEEIESRLFGGAGGGHQPRG